MRRSLQTRLAVGLALCVAAVLPFALTGRIAAQTIPGPDPPQETEVPTSAVPTPVSTSEPAAQGVGDNDLTFDVITGGDVPTEAQVTIRLSTLENLTDCNGADVNPDRVGISPVDGNGAGPLPGDLTAFGDIFRVQIYDKNNQVVCEPNLSPPAILCIVPTAEQIAAAGGIENIRIYTYDVLLGAWRQLATTIIGGNRVCSAVVSFSLFRPAGPFVAPNVPPEIPQPTAVPVPRALPDTAGGQQVVSFDWLLPLLVAGGLLAALWLWRPRSGDNADSDQQ